MSDQNKWDVCILGGGLAGLCAGIQAKQKIPSAKIIVIEKNSYPLREAAHKVGESTVELATHYFSEVLGFKEHLDSAQLPKLGLRFFFGDGENRDISKRLEIGARDFPDTSSYQLDRGRFENFLYARSQELGISIRDSAKVSSVDLDASAFHRVKYQDAQGENCLSARWLIDASGRAAILKRRLGLQKSSGHKANAAWFRMACKIDLDTWSSGSEWQSFLKPGLSRWYSTNHLMGAGYWLWIIPLSSGATSIGLVAEEKMHPLHEFNSFDRCLDWLRKYEPQCAEKIEEKRDTLQDFLALKRYSHDCKQVFSGERWAITGEAGVFLDPFYSPGSDFIALSNTFIVDMLERDLCSDSLGAQPLLYNELYLSFFRNTLKIFRDQYPVFGNPKVMPAKIVWDFATYWTFLAYLFFQDKICDFEMFLKIRGNLERIGALNEQMQDFFINWHAEDPNPKASGHLDLFSLSFLEDLNKNLGQKLSDRDFQEKLKSNVSALSDLSQEIMQRAALPNNPFEAESFSSANQLPESSFFESLGM